MSDEKQLPAVEFLDLCFIVIGYGLLGTWSDMMIFTISMNKA